MTGYPTMEDVAEASHEQLARWHRFLRSPTNDEQIDILNFITKRFNEKGGMTAAISKKIGW